MYDVDYFINKFKAIPANKWITRNFMNNKGACCAYGHCGLDKFGASETPESLALRDLFVSELSISPIDVNDTKDLRLSSGAVIKGKTPKTRILNALKLIKQLQEK